jgi:pantothenate kinase-related protein Tda10
MKTIRLLITTVLLAFAVQSMALAQTVDITEMFKKHFNETVQQVQETENDDEKRVILNESFSKMLTVIDRIDSRANLTKNESAMLDSYRGDIAEKLHELNGEAGFDEVMDEDLDDFSNYSQQYFEQADRTVTIGITTVLLIVIILLLI